MRFILVSLSVLVVVSILPLITRKELRRGYLDLVSNGLLGFLLFWKGSLLLTDGALIGESPIVLVYHMGNRINWLAGAVGVLAVLIWHRKRLKPAYRLPLILLLGGSALWFSLAPPVMRQLQEPQQKLIREAGDISLWYEGQVVTLQSLLEGEAPVILNFWASWCPPCKAEIPELNHFNRDYPHRLIGINAAATEKNPQEYEKIVNTIEYPVYRDLQGALGTLFEIKSLPTTLVVYQGRITRFSGAVSYDWLKESINVPTP